MKLVNLDKITNVLKDKISKILETSDDVQLNEKLYLHKTNYRIELRSTDSTTWLTYVMYVNIPYKTVCNRFIVKYINLFGDI